MFMPYWIRLKLLLNSKYFFNFYSPRHAFGTTPLSAEQRGEALRSSAGVSKKMNYELH